MEPDVASPSSPAKVPESSFPLRAYFGHHKCATSWITRIVMEVCFRLGLTLEVTHREVNFEPHGGLAELVADRRADFLAYTNAKTKHVQDLSLAAGFHVVRDPRDVLVSAYFSHLHSHPTDDWPELQAHREKLKSCSESEGLFLEMDFSEEVFSDMYQWDYTRDDVLEMKLERLSPRPIEGFVRIMEFMDMLDRSHTHGVERHLKSAGLAVNRLLYKGRHILPSKDDAPTVQTWPSIPVESLRAILDEKSFENLSGGREKGEEDVTSHFRKGVPGDWKNHFQDEHVQGFKDRYNDLLLKLGYEDDPDWQP